MEAVLCGSPVTAWITPMEPPISAPYGRAPWRYRSYGEGRIWVQTISVSELTKKISSALSDPVFQNLAVEGKCPILSTILLGTCISP